MPLTYTLWHLCPLLTHSGTHAPYLPGTCVPLTHTKYLLLMLLPLSFPDADEGPTHSGTYALHSQELSTTAAATAFIPRC